MQGYRSRVVLAVLRNYLKIVKTLSIVNRKKPMRVNLSIPYLPRRGFISQPGSAVAPPWVRRCHKPFYPEELHQREPWRAPESVMRNPFYVTLSGYGSLLCTHTQGGA